MMSSTGIKRIAFVVLLCVAVYIWWGNIQSFQQSFVPPVQSADASADDDGRSSSATQIEYLEPRVNPFATSAVPVPEDPRRRASSHPRPDRTQAVSPLSSRCYLKGLIKESATPQAIFVFQDSRSAILSVNDTLENWELVLIKENLTVFQNGQSKDTLWLDGKRP